MVPVAAVFGSAGVAGATAWAVAQPTSSGDYASCNVNLSPVSVTYSDSQTNLPLYGSGWGAYFNAFSVSAYCNTAWPQVGGQSMAVTMWFGTADAEGSASDVGCTQASTGGCTWATDGHVTVSCTTTSPSDHCGGGTVGCIDASYYTSSHYTGLADWQKASADPYNCATAVMHCDTQPTSAGWSTTYGYTGPGGVQPCTASYSLAGGTAVEPSDYWGTQAMALPTVAAPTVTCAVSLNSITGLATLTATSSTPAGSSGAVYSWDYGDGSTFGSALAETHTYTGSAMPPGGFSAVFTATATGDGTTAVGSSSATCSKVVDLTGATAGGGGTAPSGGDAPPATCGFLDFICSIKAAVAWLLVPSSGFFTSWSSFEGTMKTAVPFSYVTDAVAWGYQLSTGISGDLAGYSGPATEYCINFGEGGGASCGTAPSGWVQACQVVTTVAVITAFAMGVLTLARKVLGEH